MSRLALIILAAGNSERFGGVKQLAEIDGLPMLQRVVDCCSVLGDVDLHVALGAHVDDIQARVILDVANVIFNVNWAEGISSTITCVVNQLADKYDGLMFVAGDQPLLSPTRLTPMIKSWQENTDLLCCAKYSDTLGIPAIFPKRFYGELRSLRGDYGARQILRDREREVCIFHLPEAAIDIDRVEDLKNIGD